MLANEFREGLRNKLRALGYDAKLVNYDCFDIHQNGRTHYLTIDEAEALLHAGAGIDLLKHSEKRGRNRWYAFSAREEGSIDADISTN